MTKYNLSFIEDDKILEHVKDTVKKYSFSMDLKKFNKNIIDPIKMTFDAKIYKYSIDKGVENEVIRQMDKTNNNLIGYFHQNIFKYTKDVWSVPTQGFDIVNTNKGIFVEMKNKHNTMNSKSSQKTYMMMQNKLIKSPNATCMLVEVIATKSQNIPWEITLDKMKMSKNEHIRRVSVDKFYEIVTGDKFAFKKLCEKLPIILDDAVKSIRDRHNDNTVLKELKKYSEDILKSLYLLSFEKYDGFDDTLEV